MAKLTKRHVERFPTRETDYIGWDSALPGFTALDVVGSRPKARLGTFLLMICLQKAITMFIDGG